MYDKFRIVRNRHVLHAIRYSSIPSVKKIHSINSKQNQNLLLKKNRHPILFKQTRDFTLVYRTIKGLLKLRYILVGSAVGGGYQAKKVFPNYILLLIIEINIIKNY